MLKTLSRPTARNVRRPFSVGVASELLEDRIVLSAVAAAPPASNLQAPLAEITDVVVNSVEVVNGQLVANTTVLGSVLGRDFTENVQIPLNALVQENGTCDILNLSLGPVSLNVLGLNIDLDNCEGGPITVDITGETGSGNLLGNLLCGVGGLLDNGVDGLLNLGNLNGTQLEQLTGELTDILNDVFDEVLNPTTGDGLAASSHGGGQAGGRTTDILNLEVGPIHLDLLGVVVDTSRICLDVTADSGNGNLLGNLLGSIAHLLDRNPGNAVNALLNRVERIFDSLDLAAVSDELLASQGKGKR